MTSAVLIETGALEPGAPAIPRRVDGAGLCPAESSREGQGTLPGFLSDRLDRAASARRAREVRLRELVDNYVDFVARVLRNSGTPESEVDDEVQRTFIVAARRLDDIRAGAEKSFLFRVAFNQAAHARRTAARRREVAAEQAPEQVEHLATPEALTDQKRMRELLDRVLDEMEESLRAVFVLHEFEEMTAAEIADVVGIPRGTVASRLRRARSEFRARVAALGSGETER